VPELYPAVNAVHPEGRREMKEIEYGATVVALGADGISRQLRALGGVVPGGDFPVIWACSEREWAAAEDEGRAPSGIPWPAEDVKLTDVPVA
jgi:hypothetical protein